jgi:hypothetical protein
MPFRRGNTTYHRLVAGREMDTAEPLQIGFEAFGVRIAIAAPTREVMERVRRILPPTARLCEPALEDKHFALTTVDGVYHDIAFDGGGVTGSADLGVVLDVLDSQVRGYIALNAPHGIFVHAGVVTHAGLAIVIPGPSFSGKTSLVAELVRAGATYYSDEYAVLDENGLVHPYSKPLSLRDGGLSQVDHPVEHLGGTAGTHAAAVGLVVATIYRPGARWQPQPISPGEAVLHLLANTVPAQQRPAQALAALRCAVTEAVLLESERGDAADIVGELLATVAVR